MSDFILNNISNSGTLNFPKTDALIVPANANLATVVSGSEWNAVCQSLVDVRKNILSGSVFGFGSRFANSGTVPAIPGFSAFTSDYLYVRTDGALIQHKLDGSEFVIISSVLSGTQFTQYSEIDTLPSPVVLPPITQGSAILYFRSNGQTTRSE